MNQYLYLLLNLGSFIVPFAYSFEKKRINFIKFWKAYFCSITLVGLFFILWDVYFTSKGVWGFNPHYLIGIDIINLPIEEWIFFIFIPYASNFIHYSLLYFFPQPQLNKNLASYLSIGLAILATFISLSNTSHIYTFCSFGLFAILMWMQVIFRWKLFQRYSLSFLIILIPFYLVNSVLTGSFTPDPIVWYNDAENLGFRVGTIPIEDFFYCFSMLYSQALIFEYLKEKKFFKP